MADRSRRCGRARPGASVPTAPTWRDARRWEPALPRIAASADTARAELNADPGPDRLGRFRDRVLPGALARATHHEQVAVAEIMPDRRATPAARPQQEGPRRAEDDQRHHRVLRAPAADAVAVPGHRIAAVAVQAEPGGREPLAEFLLVVLVEDSLGLGERRMGERIRLVVEAEQPGDVDDLVVHRAAFGPPGDLR